MLGLDPDTCGKLSVVLYILVGVPIAFRFIRKQNMTESVRQAGEVASEFSAIVVGTLSLMWPVLLLCMGLDCVQARAKRRRKADRLDS